MAAIVRILALVSRDVRPVGMLYFSDIFAAASVVKHVLLVKIADWEQGGVIQWQSAPAPVPVTT
jgi:hypothetical protein